ncbi:uncharacterized protein LOC128745226 [Sabethes cyaneus]|uniref:uncharacterized protein LOC128745226 n=1 Tax=Sabethes cyaneus TaxID=53552 RepID=UPI00237E15B1|nr:uncharacterized protein LOC128745226 [Sabethes cyaneus]
MLQHNIAPKIYYIMRFKRSLTVIACLVINFCLVSSIPQAQINRQNPTNQLSSARAHPAYKDGQREPPDGVSELFGFPADPSMIESMRNARNRTPVYIPNKCLENEILYPGDQESDWVCDCKPTYVYHPPTRKCYEMYTQGYCENGFMIYLAQGAKKPECIRNDCYRPDPKISWVMYNGTCVQLNEYHRGCDVGKLKQFVGVNETTHELDCMNITGVKMN